MELKKRQKVSKADEAMAMFREALEEERVHVKELEARVDALRKHSTKLSAGIEAIVHMTMIEDIGDRSPEEVYSAVIKRLTMAPN